MTQEEERKRLLLERFQAEVDHLMPLTCRCMLANKEAEHATGAALPFHLGVTRCKLVFVQHPGFDFSGAEFNGAAPDAQSFMGGMPSGI